MKVGHIWHSDWLILRLLLLLLWHRKSPCYRLPHWLKIRMRELVHGEVIVTLVSHLFSSLLLLSRALSWRKCVKCLAGLCVLSEAGTVGTAASRVQMCMIWQLVQPHNMHSLRPDRGREEHLLFFFFFFQPEVFKKHLRPGRRLTEDPNAVSLPISLSELMGSN